MSHPTRMINDYSAYVVSQDFIEKDMAKDIKRTYEAEAIQQEAWLAMKMREFAEDYGMDITLAPPPKAEVVEDVTPLEQPRKSQEKPCSSRLYRLRHRANSAYLNAPDGTKRCNLCRQYLPLNQFSKNPNTPDGLYYRCRQCNALYARTLRAKRKEQIDRKNQPAKN